MGKNISFKEVMDEDAGRALCPSNYPLVAAWSQPGCSLRLQKGLPGMEKS